MGFNPLVLARLAEKTLTKNNPLKLIVNSVIYSLLTFVKLPNKMKLLNSRIAEYQRRLDKLERAINEGANEKTRKHFNTLR